jgi:hypothetical protein
MRAALLALLLFAMGCHPEWIGETPGTWAPPRESKCHLDLIHVGPADVAPDGQYDLLGYVTLMTSTVQDPRLPETMDKVRSRACRMGGEALSIWEFHAAGPSMVHTEIDYAVVRARVSSRP